MLFAAITDLFTVEQVRSVAADHWVPVTLSALGCVAGLLSRWFLLLLARGAWYVLCSLFSLAVPRRSKGDVKAAQLLEVLRTPLVKLPDFPPDDQGVLDSLDEPKCPRADQPVHPVKYTEFDRALLDVFLGGETTWDEVDAALVAPGFRLLAGEAPDWPVKVQRELSQSPGIYETRNLAVTMSREAQRELKDLWNRECERYWKEKKAAEDSEVVLAARRSRLQSLMARHRLEWCGLQGAGAVPLPCNPEVVPYNGMPVMLQFPRQNCVIQADPLPADDLTKLYKDLLENGLIAPVPTEGRETVGNLQKA